MAGEQLIDFSPLGDLFNTYKKARQQVARDQVLGQLGQGAGPLDYAQASRALLSAGDTEGGLSLARLAQQQYLTSPEYITKAKTAEAEVAAKYAPKTTDFTLPGGDKVTVQKGEKGFEVPQVQGLQPQNAVPVPVGVDPREYRQQLAKANVTNQEHTVKDAKSAADFEPIIDQAVAAYERAHNAGAIGPYAGSSLERMNEKYNPLASYMVSPEREKARQDYDKAVAALQARITAAQNKGEGAVSNFERQMYAAQFPDLTSVEPEKGLQYLRQIQAQTKQTKEAAKTTPLGQTSNVEAVIQRPSIPNGMTAPPIQPALNAWKNRETITAARANPEATLAEAKAAIAAGKDAAAVKQRLKQIGIDPSGL